MSHTKAKGKSKETKRAPSAAGRNGQSNGKAARGGISQSAAPTGQKRRRATAESMAAGQRDISVSEFFSKNRHLLGFDSPRKALLSTVKEAVDNSLDACEEAGIVPEIWVHIQQTGQNRFKVGVQDNGPGVLKRQIPLIFGKLLYGSKFHRLRMSRGQQGIGISAAVMYGVLTTGKPVKIISKISLRKPTHYYEIQIDTKKNKPEILNGRGDGVDIPPSEAGNRYIQKHGIEWIAHYEPRADDQKVRVVKSGTRITIELEARYQRGRGSVDEYLEQTAIANPHVTLHCIDADDNTRTYRRSTETLPPEPKEIKPHPYGVELGRLSVMLKEVKTTTLSQFLTSSFSRVTPAVARRIGEAAGLSTRANTAKISRGDADQLYHAIQQTKILAPTTDCISPIGEQLLLEGLHKVVPGEFYAAATRPPAVYRGNPFQIEVALAYGGAPAAQKVSLELLTELLGETDARTLRQFLILTFDGLGPDAADRILKEAGMATRQSPGKLKTADIQRLHGAMRSVNLSEGQTMQVLRYANRVPLQFQHAACAITQAVINNNWRSYGLSQSRGSLPSGPITVMLHMASVWVPFTSESKEAIAGYPEIQKELRLALQAVGRKLGMFLRRRQKVVQEGQRRNVFVRYLREVATAVSQINSADSDELYEMLAKVAMKRTSQADMKLDENGRPFDPANDDFGGNVLVVKPNEAEAQLAARRNGGTQPNSGEAAADGGTVKTQ